MELTHASPAFSPARAVSPSPSAAVSVLYRRYGDEVLRFCFLCLGSVPDAERALQETFLRIWQEADAHPAGALSTPQSHVMRTACRVLRKHLRPFRKRSYPADALPLTGIVSAEEEQLLLDILHLPETDRIVFLMVCLQGMTVRETGEALCMRETSVQRRLQKAKDALGALEWRGHP